jgi:nucleotide-binding universal stress UspA family protein
MKTILVATDFSPAAFNAANYAADMALAIDAELWLLHVYQVPVVYYEIPVVLTGENLMEDAQKRISRLKEELTRNTEGKLQIQTEIRMGIFFPELKSVCERVKPYTVVMGSQGTTATERLFFGGHTVYAMKHLMWPLIAVPEKSKFSLAKKIGLASDFDKVVETIPLDEIKMLVNDFHSELHVINTGKKKEFKADMIFESGLLQEILAPLNPSYDLITHENTDEGILNFADKNHIDLLLVLPKRHGLLGKLTHKSHTKQLVLHSHVPVMALHQ